MGAEMFGTILITLLLVHRFADWMLQTEYQAVNKAQGSFFNGALVRHCMVYTCAFIPAFWFFGLEWYWLLFIFATHMVIDRRWPVVYWIKGMQNTSEETMKAVPILAVEVDQTMHYIVLGVVAWFSTII